MKNRKPIHPPQSRATVSDRQKATLPSVPAEKALADDIGIKKADEFVKFLQWSSLPDVYKGKSVDYLREIGIKEPEMLELMAIKTKAEFAAKYQVRASTLSAWSNTIDREGLREDIKQLFTNLSKNVYGAFYHATLQHADAQRVRLWEEIFNGKQPEDSVPQANQAAAIQVNTFVVQLRGEFTNRIREFYEQNIRAGEVPSDGGIHTAAPDKRGGAKKRDPASERNEEAPASSEGALGRRGTSTR